MGRKAYSQYLITAILTGAVQVKIFMSIVYLQFEFSSKRALVLF